MRVFPSAQAVGTRRGLIVALAFALVGVLLAASFETAHAQGARGRVIQRAEVQRTHNRQAALVEKALSRIERSPAAHAQMFFVGAAPFASQDVFKRELGAVHALFDDRFKTRGRSIRLVNHRRTIKTTPLASLSNLGRVLAGVGERMDRDKDILVLFITTHGTKGVLQVELPRFRLNDITPDDLATVLERSKITNRVLIISACHSGSFIERLTGPDTLIMTAAHAEKTSFGCSNEREWTYFGDALFNRALRKTRSLMDAFEEARQLVGEWEAKDGYVPSDPQVSLGKRIAPKLDALIDRLETQSAGRLPVVVPVPVPGRRPGGLPHGG